MLLLIDNYDSFTCNIASLFETFDVDVIIKKNNKISLQEIGSLSPDFLVIGPGPGTPENAGISIPSIKKFKGKIPILGICLGHQAIAEAFDGKTIKSQIPSHGKIEEINHNGKNIFQNIKPKIKAVRYNSLTIDQNSIPDELDIIARNTDNEIMAIYHKNYPIYGVQFHPESVFSEEGEKIFRNFLSKKIF